MPSNPLIMSHLKPPPPATQPLSIGYPWVADARDGTYRNPILCLDYSDPDVCRDGQDYWMTASSFANTPGLPILHSRDLVNWSLVNYALHQVPAEGDIKPLYATPRTGCGVWAPSIRKHEGLFYIFFPTPDEGIYVTTATDPRATWSPPWMLMPGKGYIDPCPLWDDDGKAYLVFAYAGSRAGIKDRLHVKPMSWDARQILGEGQVVYHNPTDHRTLEGPKFHKWNGMYYISAPAGGVATGWQVIFRSNNPYGPYEEKVVLAQGDTPINGPHQGAIIDTPDGNQWWFLHFQDAGIYGRITHLQPVLWKDRWPLMGINHDPNGKGQPVLRYHKPSLPPQPIVSPPTSDDFSQPTLGLQWQWEANHDPAWYSLSARPGMLRLKPLGHHIANGADDLRKYPNILAQKLPARSFSLQTEVHISTHHDAQGGLIVIGKQHAALTIENSGPSTRVVLIVNNQRVESHFLDRPSVKLQLAFADGGLCSFSFQPTDEPPIPLKTTFQAVEGHWVGTRIGLFARSLTEHDSPAHVDFNHFHFSA